ncbi:MAG: N-acetyl-gamma-glutamyl-phosphate reductase, partial [Actinomycetota bacterium]|nr:N-acetyl-gamma-glutamyl-phosphate reductase [Actinomycetota bacterium]
MTTVHVIGAAGYAGAQLAALVHAHPHFTLGQVTARADVGKRIVDVAPEYRVDAVLQEMDLNGVGAGDFAAVCYPHAEAAAVV